ncbi:MAG TPA: helix-turn-helix domain-containing protein [Pseudonocardiaceae bacterium]|nr:helix-turn-helix domain-containing protein [Pseudonocardiaceae bacterium]
MSTDPRVATWSPACQAIALLLGPYVEVVLHDAAADTVLAIWNPMTSRKPGEASLLGELDDLEPSANDVYGPYEKLLPDGRRLSSVSAILRDQNLVLCLNFDRGPLTQAAALLSQLAAPIAPRPEPLFAQDWVERINHIVGAFVVANGKPVSRLSRTERLDLLAELDDAGIFAVRRAVPVVAAALDASRSTVYSLLAELKDGRS